MTATADPADTALIKRILGEYQEMPGLALTLDQAQKLWGCEAEACRVVVDYLVAHGFLRWSRDRRLVRGSQGFEALS